MTRDKCLAAGLALFCFLPVVLALNSAGINGVPALVHKCGYQLFSASLYFLVALCIGSFVTLLKKKSYRDELRISLWFVLLLIGLLGIWLIVGVYDMRGDPHLREELWKALPDSITKIHKGGG